MKLCFYLLSVVLGVVSSVAGYTLSGFVNGLGSVARFNNPKGVSIMSNGDMLVVDSGNNLIRKITSTGESTLPSSPPPLSLPISHTKKYLFVSLFFGVQNTVLLCRRV